MTQISKNRIRKGILSVYQMEKNRVLQGKFLYARVFTRRNVIMMKRKFSFIILIFLIALLAMGGYVFADNEGLSILKGDGVEYLLYVQNYENTVFEFAYANSNTVDKESLRYRAYASDVLGNKIAYINQAILDTGVFDSEPVYIWVRRVSNKSYILNGIKINLTKVVDAETLEEVSDVTRRISVDVSKNVVTKETIDDKEVTITQGKIVLENKTEEYEYQIIRVKNDPSHNNLIELARRIAKFDDNTPNSVKIEIYTAFYEEFEALKPSLDSVKWLSAENNEILQPEDTEDGEVYLVWLKEVGTETIDFQIMTAKKLYEEEKVKEIPKGPCFPPVFFRKFSNRLQASARTIFHENNSSDKRCQRKPQWIDSLS